jgi:DNA-binding MltR family transcriptional regulator
MTTKLPVEPLTQGDILRILSQQTEAGNALVIAGLIEDQLQKVLLAAGRQLSNRTAKVIFDGMGPLSTFSAKIEIAFMFELIEKPVRDDLRVIKRIRNAFAHTSRNVHFGTRHIAEECRKLSNWTEEFDNQDCFRARALECFNEINKKMEMLMFTQALREEPSVDIEDGS